MPSDDPRHETTACRHIVTRSRGVAGGSECVECGALVMLVHDRPCRECQHARQLSDGWICRHHLMAISADMRVTYYVEPGPGRSGLCFVEAPHA